MSEILSDWFAGLTLQDIAKKHNMTVQAVTKTINQEWGKL